MPRTLGPNVKLSLVIPCYNEEEVLPLLFDRVRTAMSSWNCECEVVLIDDGSTDGTWAKMQECRKTDPRWKLVRLARNFGHQIALWTGLKHVSGQVIAVLDADLQDPPEILPRFLVKWEEGYDVIYAIRQKRKEGPFKKLAYFFYYRLLAFLSEIDIPLDSGDFCVMDRRVLDAMLQTREQAPFVRGVRAWVGFKQTGLAYERDRRAAGSVKYTLSKLVHLALSGIFSFSTRPLKLSTYMGVGVSGLAFCGVMLSLVQHLFPAPFAWLGMGPVPGNSALVMAVLFLGGVQLVCLGILGEYVGRIYENVKGRPLVVIGETEGVESGPPRPALRERG